MGAKKVPTMSHVIIPNVWYFPSRYGDIRLEKAGPKKTKIIYFKLTQGEAAAMTHLREASIRRKWASQELWDTVQTRDFQTGEAQERLITLDISLATVGALLKKHLSPGRDTVTVIRVGDGKIEEMREREVADPETAPVRVDASATDPKSEPANEDKAVAKTGTDGAATKPVKAATVKKPTVGCPAPSFSQIKLRATRVLRAFLTPQQAADFDEYQRFVTVGADTGHRYMLTSRNAPDELSKFGRRCVFDLDENRSYCVHDWEVPAEEELLALHCLISLPGHESWARGMADVTPAGVGVGDLDALLAAT